MRKILFLILSLLTCVENELFAQSDTITLNSSTNNHSYYLCDGIFQSGTYSNSIDYSVTLCPTTPNSRIILNFSTFDIQYLDRIVVYQGRDTLAPLLYTFLNIPYFSNRDLLFSDLQPEPIDTSGCLTIRFKSQMNNTASNWYSTIRCESLCQDLNASLDSVFRKYDVLGNMITQPVKHIKEIDSITGDTIKYNAIDFCKGDSIVLIAKAIFPYNDLSYHQSDSSCIFKWNFGDGHSDSVMYHNDVGHKWNDSKGYNLSLSIYDTTNGGCISRNAIDTRIRMSNNPIGLILPLSDICSADTLKIALDTIEFNQTAHESYSVKTFIPDGSCDTQNTGACYESPVTFTTFTPGSIIQSGNEILSVVMNAEHSFLGDLGFWLICPNGQYVTLKYNTHSGGADLGIANLIDNPINRCDTLLNPPGIGWNYGWSNQYLTNSRGVIDGNEGIRIDSTNVYSHTKFFQTPQQNILSTIADLTGFNALVGCPLNGIWRLKVCDDWMQDNGYIFSWDMTLRNAVTTDWTYNVLVDTFSINGPFSSRSSSRSSLINPPADTSGLFLYDIHIVDNFDCIWDSSFTIGILNMPILNLADTMNICPNATITLDAGNPNAISYTWNPIGRHTRIITINPQIQDSVIAVTVVNSNNNISCSATDTIRIGFIYLYDTTINANVCAGEIFSQYNFNENETGIYIDTFQAVSGCDSIIKLNLTVFPVYDTTIIATICNGEIFSQYGFSESHIGTYIDTLQTVNGCDSIVSLNLTVFPHYDSVITAQICQGETYSLNGFNQNTSGIFIDTLQTIMGCDSIIKLNLRVNPIYDTTFYATICKGEHFIQHGFNIIADSSATYIDSLQTTKGCDSIIRLNLIVMPVYDTTIVANICQGMTYNENGFLQTQSGLYTQKLQSINGCDSIVNLSLHVSVLQTTIDDTICERETYQANGFNESQTGTYTHNLQTPYDCDSVVTLNLFVRPVYDTTIDVVVDSGDTYNQYGITASQDGTYEGVFPNENGCQGVITVHLIVFRKIPLFVPNAFTPLSDINNVFCYYTDIDSVNVLSFEIFDRWGTKLYSMLQSTKYGEPYQCWDGKYQGTLCPMGTYVYKISYITFFTGTRRFFKQGTFQLIR